MRFSAELVSGDVHVVDDLHDIGSITAAMKDTVVSMTEIINTDFDGFGRRVSARIMDENDTAVAALSLTLEIDRVE